LLRKTESDFRDSSLVTVLRRHCHRQPERPAYTFLTEGGRTAEELTYGELDRQARSVAAVLQERGLRGQRVLLLYVPGLDFITALWGCFYAGAVAVPCYPPEPERLERTLPRLQAILQDAAPALLLSTSTLLELAQGFFAPAEVLAQVPREASDLLARAGREAQWHEPQVQPEDLALIQYTSGSTATPKGVTVPHRALSANLEMMQQTARGYPEDTVFSSWLPFYHDFGLVGGILLPVFLGVRSVLMPPFDFLRQPLCWLESMHRYRVTDSFAPNFALELCVRKTAAEERQALDLRHLRSILIGAEPVRQATLERFTEAFAPQGLPPGALYPSYGLAESVLGVSGGPRHNPCRAVFLDAEQLARNRWVEVERTHPRAQSLVGCGKVLPEVEVRIVDPHTCQPLPTGQVGEVWVSGPNVASGYWRHPEDTEHTFHARLATGEPRHFLRTGDMGYLLGGELFIAGRLKDLIILRGRNYYPQDLELSVERGHPRVRPGCVAAFSYEDKGEERVVVVAEVDTRGLPPGEEREQVLHQVVRSLLAAVSAEHSLALQAVALVQARSIDKTSSGKIARRAARQRFLSGTLELELLWTAESGSSEVRHASGPGTEEDPRRTHLVAALHRAGAAERTRLLIGYIERELRSVVGRSALRLLDPEMRLQEVGLDSLGALDLAGRMEKDLGVAVPAGRLLDGLSVRELVEHVLRNMEFREAHAPQRVAPLVLSLQPLVVRQPLFFVGGALGASLYLRSLAQALGPGQPFCVLQYPGLQGQEPPLRTVEALARRLLEEVLAVQPRGPYALAGHSFGGLVVYELAQQLRQRGEPVSHLLLLDSALVAAAHGETEDAEVMALFELLNCLRRLEPASQRPVLAAESLAGLGAQEQRQFLRKELGQQEGIPPGFPLHLLVNVFLANMEAMRGYQPLPADMPVVLLRAREGFPPHTQHPARKLLTCTAEAALGWSEVCSQLQVVEVPGDHFTLVTEPHVQSLAQVLRERLASAGTWEIDFERLASRRAPVPRARRAEARRGPVEFNPLREDYVADPYPLLEELRQREPVHWSPLGAWCVTRYRDITSGLRDRRFSVHKPPRSSERRQGPSYQSWQQAWQQASPALAREWLSSEANDPLFQFHQNSMMFIDPPRHTRMRRILAGAFEPAVVRRWHGFVEHTVEGLLADMRQHPEPDLVRDLALPLPTAVICEMLGIPGEDVPMLRGWSLDVTRALDMFISDAVYQAAARSAAEFIAYLREHLQRRRRQQGTSTDLLTLMSEAEAEGERLTSEELLANCLLLFSAGYITTTHVIGNAVLALSKAPDQVRRLREQPGLIESAVEELLRYEGALRQVLRIATEDLELGGKRIRRGDAVLFMLGAGNRDPEAFPEPHRLDLARPNARQHLAFAHGIHYCLGASLARLELQVALRAVVQRLPDLRILPQGLKWQRSIALRGLEQMRIAFDGALGG
jgi:acyl-CoA synthetase (AMP-forming)/AMP-acid ligase II/cytochrome P450/thioesterase domain-containing protein